MSDLTLIAEYIRNAMEAVDEAHQAGKELRQEVNHEALDAFRNKMAELENHLKLLKSVLDNEEAYAMDELVEALSAACADQNVEYRRSPHTASRTE